MLQCRCLPPKSRVPPTAAVAVCSAVTRATAATGRPLQQLMWRPHLQRLYARELDPPTPAARTRRCIATADSGDIVAAEEHVYRALVMVAEGAGEKQVAGTPRPVASSTKLPSTMQNARQQRKGCPCLRAQPRPTADDAVFASHSYHWNIGNGTRSGSGRGGS